MKAPEASKAMDTPWPLVWEILLAVFFAITVAIGIVTVVLPELAAPPAESVPHRGAPSPATGSGSGPAAPVPTAPTPPPP